MWGSSFANLAKKAQELQEQASHLTAGEIFNLDAMAAEPQKKSEPKPIPEHSPTPQPSFSLPPLSAPSAISPSATSPTPPSNPACISMKPQMQKGKLKMTPKGSPKANKSSLKGKKNLLTKISSSEDNLEAPPAFPTQEVNSVGLSAKEEQEPAPNNADKKNAVAKPIQISESKVPHTEKGTTASRPQTNQQLSEGELIPISNEIEDESMAAFKKIHQDNIEVHPVISETNEERAVTATTPDTKGITPEDALIDDDWGRDDDSDINVDVDVDEVDVVDKREAKIESTKPSSETTPELNAETSATKEEDESNTKVALVDNGGEDEANGGSGKGGAEKSEPEINVESSAPPTADETDEPKPDEPSTESDAERKYTEAVTPAPVPAATGLESFGVFGNMTRGTDQAEDKANEGTTVQKTSAPSDSIGSDVFSMFGNMSMSGIDHAQEKAAIGAEKANCAAPPAVVNEFNNIAPASNAALSAVNDERRSKEGLPTLPVNAGADAEQVMQQFTSQLQRIEANFEAERQEMAQQHTANIQQAIAAKVQEIEQLTAKMKEKDLQLRDMKRSKEGKELRMDSLMREVEGIKQLLEQRDAEIEELKKAKEKDRRQLENQVRTVEGLHAKTQRELKALQDELKNSKGELGSTNEEYTTLKSRVKVIAIELKERRSECRELKTKIEDMNENRERLEDHVSTLESQLKDRDRSGTEKDEETAGLRATIAQLEQKVREAVGAAKAREDEFEKNLGSYKKKAQNSLAVANSRAAAAVQAKEEAELEARAARNMADSTMERAMVAEANGRKAMADAKEYFREMEEAKTKAEQSLKAIQVELNEKSTTAIDLQEKLEQSSTEMSKLAAEKAQMARDAEMERTTSANLQRELTGAQHRCRVFEANVSNLKIKLQAAEAAADSAHESQKSKHSAPVPTENSASKGTVMMLQSQLKEANGTILELQEALQNAVTLNEKERVHSGAASSEGASTTNGGDVPLFYAMEKQAELNTARNEINRLSSLYADVQSEKAEAEEALAETRKELDEQRSKLQRFEKMSTSAVNRSTNGSAATPAGENANIEYLKNIMLSFLNAKTVAEKKGLVPVIGAVLCLTPDETKQAIKNVESAASLEGFGLSLFETIGSKVNKR